jgi:hypothetical protein
VESSHIGQAGEAFDIVNPQMIDDPRRVEVPTNQLQRSIQIFDEPGLMSLFQRKLGHNEAELDTCHNLSKISEVAQRLASAQRGRVGLMPFIEVALV